MSKFLMWFTVIGGYALILLCAVVGAQMVLFETTLPLKIIGLIVVYITTFAISITIHEIIKWRKNRNDK